jgi:predicted Zn finger-like uncharacterized protein
LDIKKRGVSMIVQCEKCGTKYNLDDTKVRPGETKVKCSHCQHVFTVPHPLALDEGDIFGEREEKAEEAFIKEWARESPPLPPQEPQQSVPPPTEQAPPPRAFVPPAEDEPLFGEEAPAEEAPAPDVEALPFRPMPAEEAPTKEKRKISTGFLLLIFLLVIIAGALYYWSKMGRSIPAFEYIYEKIYTLMEGKKEQRLFLLYLKGSEHSVEGGNVFAIQGKVANRSQETKQSVKLKASLFDKVGKEVATATSFCGVTITDEEIKNSTLEELRSSFGFIPVGRARPVPPQQSVPFTIIFFSPPEGATQYQVEIVEAGEAA